MEYEVFRDCIAPVFVAFFRSIPACMCEILEKTIQKKENDVIIPMYLLSLG